MTDPNPLISMTSTQARDETQGEQFNHLLSRSQLIPRPFESTIPLIGPVIAWFRTAWNSVSTRWYMAPLLQQQSEYNYSVVRELQILNQNIQSLQMQIHQISQEQERYQHVSAAEQQFLKNLIIELQALRVPIADLQALTHHLTMYTQQLQAEQQNLRLLSDEVSERLTATDQDLAFVLHDLSNVTYTLIRADKHASGSNMSSN